MEYAYPLNIMNLITSANTFFDIKIWLELKDMVGFWRTTHGDITHVVEFCTLA